MKIRKMRHLWSTRLHNYPRGHQRQHHQPCKVSLNTPFTHGKCCLLAATALVENPVNQPCSVTSGSAASTAFVLPAFQNLIPLQPLRVQLEILHNQQEPAQSSGWAEDRMCLPGEQQHAWSCPATLCQGAGLQSQGKGLQKGSKMWLVDIHTHTIVIYPHPTSHPFLKMSADLLSPETELDSAHLVQAELTKATPETLSSLPRLTKPLTVVATHLCHGTPRDSSTPTGISLHHLPSLLAHNWKMGMVCKRHMNDTEDCWIYVGLQSHHFQIFLCGFSPPFEGEKHPQ